LGNERVSSLVMLGAVSKFIPLQEVSWQKVLGERIPAKLLDINRRAFAAGQNAISQ